MHIVAQLYSDYFVDDFKYYKHAKYHCILNKQVITITVKFRCFYTKTKGVTK